MITQEHDFEQRVVITIDIRMRQGTKGGFTMTRPRGWHNGSLLGISGRPQTMIEGSSILPYSRQASLNARSSTVLGIERIL